MAKNHTGKTTILELVERLKSDSEITSLKSDVCATQPRAKKLWSIRQRAIAAGLELLNEAEIEQEIALRRGGTRDS